MYIKSYRFIAGLFASVLFFHGLTGCTQPEAVPEDAPMTSADTENIPEENVDERIDTLLASEEYQAAPTEERAKLVDALLQQMKESGTIRQYHYFSEEAFFSFEYSDGSAGGVMLKDFSSEFNNGPLG